MTDETVEELVNKMKSIDDKVDLFSYSLGLKDGAKWHQKISYNEIEVKQIAKDSFLLGQKYKLIGKFNNWFQQIKISEL